MSTTKTIEINTAKELTELSERELWDRMRSLQVAEWVGFRQLVLMLTILRGIFQARGEKVSAFMQLCLSELGYAPATVYRFFKIAEFVDSLRIPDAVASRIKREAFGFVALLRESPERKRTLQWMIQRARNGHLVTGGAVRSFYWKRNTPHRRPLAIRLQLMFDSASPAERLRILKFVSKTYEPAELGGVQLHLL